MKNKIFRPFKTKEQLDKALNGTGAYSAQRADLFWRRVDSHTIVDQDEQKWVSDLLSIGKIEDYGKWVTKQ